MFKIFTAAALALSLIAGPAFAQGNAPAPNASAPISQPAKTDAKTTDVKTTVVSHATKGKTVKAHVKHVKHAKHAKHIKHVKRVKPSTEKTRG